MSLPSRFMIKPNERTIEALARIAKETGRDPRDIAAEMAERGLENSGYLLADSQRLTLVFNSPDRVKAVIQALRESFEKNRAIPTLPESPADCDFIE